MIQAKSSRVPKPWVLRRGVESGWDAAIKRADVGTRKENRLRMKRA